ncbi:hypothetical protein GCM10010358_39160 [Streptomyces minutiscleroticus]|uniref:Uncharacterized protein n=1 Tax=Streptomyces minutiscleroticus TaxID=68238 RepID=A0A918U183_9ACTN|nr:hypothetical protein GCM10010358_39160 [Streptomyces minutiscleroticus]
MPTRKETRPHARRAVVRTANPVREVTVHNPHLPARAQGQVFGLVGTSAESPGPAGTYHRRFPGPDEPGALTAFAPTHRCGTVPDAHRVPSCVAPSHVRWGAGREPTAFLRLGAPVTLRQRLFTGCPDVVDG